ncbi:MAG: pyridoxamine 5-phosphate oxidase [Pseudonocardiales bacterium]|nr:pyridoxamine 5-phosphate oxidase [Pseudonocardiales bacterium]
MMTTGDRELLARPLHGLLTIAPVAEWLPAPRPVWFELTGQGLLQLFSVADALKVRQLTATPRASLVVVRPAGESEGWVSIQADVTIHSHGARDLALRLAERYWDMSTAEHRAAADEWAVGDLRRIVLDPSRVTRGPA